MEAERKSLFEEDTLKNEIQNDSDICNSTRILGFYFVARIFFMATPDNSGSRLISIIGTAAFSAIGTLIVVYVTKLITGGLRVTKENEIAGLDSSVHGERAFEI